MTCKTQNHSDMSHSSHKYKEEEEEEKKSLLEPLA